MRLNIAPEMRGQTIQCPGCKNAIKIPGEPPPIQPTGGPENPVGETPPTHSPQPHEVYSAKDPFPSQQTLQPNYGQYGAAPPPRQGNPLVWIFGCLGGGCLLVVIFGILIALLLPAIQQVRKAARDANREAQNFHEEREGFQTQLTRKERDPEPAPVAPQKLFDTVQYPSPVGGLTAYVGKDPGDGKRHPAIIWIFGGFSNGIGDTAWVPQPPQADQSASVYRKSGIIMMYPSLRGGSGNPGHMECFLGEVDDVLAAAEYLSRLPYVDPERIYLGGHSTGGTLVLLCTAASDRFRATLSLGPVDDISGYGQDVLPFSIFNQKELKVRNPIEWVRSIKTPTFIVEGSAGNAQSANALGSEARDIAMSIVTFSPEKTTSRLLGLPTSTWPKKSWLTPGKSATSLFRTANSIKCEERNKKGVKPRGLDAFPKFFQPIV